MLAYLYYHHMGWGWAVLMTLGWLALLGLFVWVVTLAIRERRSPPSARELLDRRLAKGELSIEDYERARAAMSREGPGARTAGPFAPA
jgi:uncharacterized membrane protein